MHFVQSEVQYVPNLSLLFECILKYRIFSYFAFLLNMAYLDDWQVEWLTLTKGRWDCLPWWMAGGMAYHYD